MAASNEKADRRNALLTDKQRAFLAMSDEEREEEYSKQTISYHAKNIRERLRVGLADVTFLLEELPLEELEQALADDPQRALDEPVISPSPADLVTLACLAEELSPNYGTGVQGQDPRPQPETMLQVGVRKALRLLGQSLKDLIVTIERGDPLEELAEKDPSTLTGNELDQLRAADLLSREEYALAILGEKDEQ